MSKDTKTELVRLTNPNPSTWVLEICNGVDNRLSNVVCDQLLDQIQTVERQWRERWAAASQLPDPAERRERGSGALVIMGNLGQDKFFSNGFIWEQLVTIPGFIHNYFAPIMVKLLTFPIPTIAAINGHAFAGGFVLAMCCDYRVMTTGKAWCCMNEIHFGAPLPHDVAALLVEKIKNPQSLRMVSQGYRWTPEELVAAKLVDEVAPGGSPGVLEAAIKRADRVRANASMGSYGLTKRQLYRHCITKIQTDLRTDIPLEAVEANYKRAARL